MARQLQRRALSTGAALATVVGLLVIPSAQATLSGLGSTFNAGDGNMAAAAADPHDWGDFATTPSTAGDSVLQASTPDEYKGTGHPDNAYSNGAKEDDNPATTGFGGVPPNKDDFTHMYIATEHASASPNHDFLYMAWERTNNSGTAFESFEFNQASVLGANGLPLRTKGDLLVLYDLLNGGSTPDIHVATWQDATNDAVCDNAKDNNALTGCWGVRREVDSTKEEASINSGLGSFSGAFTDPISGMAQGTSTFGEAAIDLEASNIFSASTCAHFGYAFLASRSSSAVDATMKDFVTPAPINVSNCATLSWTKVDDVTGNALTGSEFTIYNDLGTVGAYNAGTDTVLHPTTTLSADVTASATTIPVSSAAGLPSRGTFYVTIGSETIKVDSVAANALHVAARGASSTTAAAHAKNATVTWTGTCEPTTTSLSTAATCTVGNLLFGHYVVRETTVPTGYQKAPDWFPNPTTTTTVTHEFRDQRAAVDLTVSKVDDAATPVAIPICGAVGAVAGSCAAFALYNDVATPTPGAVAAGFHSPSVWYDTAVATALTAGVTDSATTLPVTSTVGFPTAPFKVRVDDELIAISGTTATSMTVAAAGRGTAGTTAAAHASAAAVTLAVLGEDTATGTSCTPSSTTGSCTFEGVPTGADYWIVETATPSGYSTAAPLAKTLTVGGGSQTVTMTDPRLFKVITLVCKESDSSLYASKVAYDGAATPAAANTPAGNAALAAAVCGLFGTYVHGDVPTSGPTHTATVTIP